MKRTLLEKLEGKRLGTGNSRGGQGTALSRREQALAKKRELLQGRRGKPPTEAK